MKEEQRIHRGDLYYADLRLTLGCEQGGVRPVVILQNNTGNLHSPTVIVAPITGKKKRYLPTHVNIEHPLLFKDSLVLLEQIRTIDKCRLLSPMGRLDDEYILRINKATEISLGL